MLLATSFGEFILRMPDILRVFLAVWLFAVGGCVGSFLNVVILRMPAGIGIARSGSRCPVCFHPIRWHDNIPILSWLMLRGRCRDCATGISIRYPLVELLVAVVFLVLGLREGLSSGRNLPLLPGAASYTLLTGFQVWTIYAFHVMLLVTLLGAALIERDGHAVPRRLFVPALAVGSLAPICLPWLHPVPARWGMVSDWHWLALITVLAGLGAGALMGCLVWPATSSQPRRPGAAPTALIACTLAGLCVGWQAVGPLVLVTAAAFLIGSLVACLGYRFGRGSWCMYLSVVLLATLLGWRTLVHYCPLAGPEASPWQALGSGLLLLLVSFIIRWYTPAREFTQIEKLEERRMTPVDPDKNLCAIMHSQSYLPVEYDAKFLQQWETRPVRVQLELLKAEIGFMQEGVRSTVVVFGSTQIVQSEQAQQRLQAAREMLAQDPHDPARGRAVARAERIIAKSHYYDAARQFAELVSSHCQIDGKCDYVIMTGGGPGIMEAANRGAFDVGAKSVGLNISLPAEQVPNAYITPQLCFQFHYFALRKMHFLMRAKAMVVFPGGFGTLDELFDALTLRQTHRMQEIPIILFGQEFWQRVIDFQFLADEGVIADRDLELISFVETPQEAWSIITRFHHHQA